MRALLNQIDFIIECRDYRIPLTSRNPMFEESLADRERVIVYTKKDLGDGIAKVLASLARNRPEIYDTNVCDMN